MGKLISEGHIKKTTMDVISRNMPRFKYTLHKIYTKALNLSNLMVYNFFMCLNHMNS